MCAITAAYDLEKAWNLANSQSNRGRDGFGFGDGRVCQAL